jgi:hypothetical protein
MKLGEALAACRDYFATELGNSVDSVVAWTGELPDSIDTALARTDITRFLVLIGLRATGPVVVGAANQTLGRGAKMYLTVIRAHGAHIEDEMLELMDLVSDIHDAINKNTSPRWWSTAGFKGMEEAQTNNFSSPTVDYSAYEIERNLVLC